mmetsp:Transcript_54495/g.99863  ORF Transcript_54495/g.99863 Transcript_54495/m.99863 type:complete len:205 (+) Transcript_54495:1533-2147(+)
MWLARFRLRLGSLYLLFLIYLGGCSRLLIHTAGEWRHVRPGAAGDRGAVTLLAAQGLARHGRTKTSSRWSHKHRCRLCLLGLLHTKLSNLALQGLHLLANLLEEIHELAVYFCKLVLKDETHNLHHCCLLVVEIMLLTEALDLLRSLLLHLLVHASILRWLCLPLLGWRPLAVLDVCSGFPPRCRHCQKPTAMSTRRWLKSNPA